MALVCEKRCLVKRVLTGARSSGTPHLGNYLGAFQPAIELSKQHELFFFVADLHSLNGQPQAEDLKHRSQAMLASLLACGLYKDDVTLYCQSMVPEITELAWHLGCWASYGLMQRSVAYKDAVAKEQEVNMGVFNYPILMAADILAFKADMVPVGKDQKQHLEVTRDLAVKWNNHYGECLTVPEVLIAEDVGLVPGVDGAKMSKSTDNVIPLFATDKEWKKRVMSIVTSSEGLDDVKDPEKCHVYRLYQFFSSQDEQAEMADKYRAGGYGFGHAKKELLVKIQEEFSEGRDAFFDWMKRPNDMMDLALQGAAKARLTAQPLLAEVKQRSGLLV